MARRTAIDRLQPSLQFGTDAPNRPNSHETHDDIDFDFRRDLKRAIDDCGLSRAAVAAAMTDLLYGNAGAEGEVTRSQLDSWCAHSKDSWRFPATHLAAFVAVTGAAWILEKLALRCGCLVIPQDEAALVELGRLIAQREGIEERERELLRAMPVDLVKRVARSPKARR